ncbi:MAG: hypothetical protein AAGF31_06345 [Planctomycetota bacterium]
MNNTTETLVRWAGRLTATSLAGMLVLIAVGHGGLPDLRDAPTSVVVEFIATVVMFAGFLIGWKWELLGGVAIVLGFLAFNTTELLANGAFAGGLLPLFILPGAFYLVAGWLASNRSQQPAMHH